MHIFISCSDLNIAKKKLAEINFSESKKRIALITDGSSSFKRYLQADSNDSAIIALNTAPKPLSGNWCLQFTGQGCQRPNMMHELYLNIPEFRKHMDECLTLYEKKFGASLAAIIFSDKADIHATNWTQPALFAVEYAMAKTWLAYGLKPEFVLGHSVGEYPAAVIAGVMSLATGIELIGHRGNAMQSITSKGSMAALMCNYETAINIIKSHDIEIDIAGINSNSQTVVSGDESAVNSLIEAAKTDRVRARALTVSHAFHSSHMEPILADYTKIAESYDYQKPTECQIVSNLTGKIITDAIDASYLAKHIRAAVDYVGGIKTVVNAGTVNFLEVGPHPILNGLAAKTITDTECNYFESVNVKSELDCFYTTAGKLFEQGILQLNLMQELFN